MPVRDGWGRREGEESESFPPHHHPNCQHVSAVRLCNKYDFYLLLLSSYFWKIYSLTISKEKETYETETLTRRLPGKIKSKEGRDGSG